MTTIYVEGELPGDGITIRQGKNGILIREEIRRYTVVTDNAFVDKIDILAHPDVPKFGMVISDMTVKAMNAERQADHQFRWIATITLSSEVDENQKDQNPDSPSTDPTTWTPVARATFEPYEDQMRIDQSSPPKFWLNSAQRPFETGFQRTRRIAVVPFSQFEPISTSLDQIMDRCDTINSAAYKTRAKYQLLLTVENANIVRFGSFRCWRVDYICKLKRDTWIIKQLDHGPGFVDSGGKYRVFYEEQWENGTYDATQFGQTPFVGLLDGSGRALSNQRTGTPVFLEFQGNRELDFNSFLRVVFTTT